MLLEAFLAPYHPQGISAGPGAEELGQMWEEGLPLTHSFATKSGQMQLFFPSIDVLRNQRPPGPSAFHIYQVNLFQKQTFFS